MARFPAWFEAVTVLVVLAACRQTRSDTTLQSRNGAVSAAYQFHRNVDFTAFLKTQPEGSADALILDAMPPPVIVVAKVSLVAKAVDSPHPAGFTTTLWFSDGTSVSKHWEAASGTKGSDYRAIFGMPKDIVRADTVLAATQ
jgi:hypothetical protein